MGPSFKRGPFTKSRATLFFLPHKGIFTWLYAGNCNSKGKRHLKCLFRFIDSVPLRQQKPLPHLRQRETLQDQRQRKEIRRHICDSGPIERSDRMGEEEEPGKEQVERPINIKAITQQTLNNHARPGLNDLTPPVIDPRRLPLTLPQHPSPQILLNHQFLLTP